VMLSVNSLSNQHLELGKLKTTIIKPIRDRLRNVREGRGHGPMPPLKTPLP